VTRRVTHPQVPFAWQRCPNSHTLLPHLHLPSEPPESTHDPADPSSQSASPSHVHAHAVQLKPAGHSRPQPPQFWGSVPRF